MPARSGAARPLRGERSVGTPPRPLASPPRLSVCVPLVVLAHRVDVQGVVREVGGTPVRSVLVPQVAEEGAQRDEVVERGRGVGAHSVEEVGVRSYERDRGRGVSGVGECEKVVDRASELEERRRREVCHVDGRRPRHRRRGKEVRSGEEPFGGQNLRTGEPVRRGDEVLVRGNARAE